MYCNLELCACCKSMVLLTERSLQSDPSSFSDADAWNAHHVSSTLLVKAAADGCPFCVLLYATFTFECHGKEDEKPRFLRAMDSTSVRYSFIAHPRKKLWMYHFFMDSSEGPEIQPSDKANILIIPIFGNDFASLKATNKTGSDESIELARNWIQMCIERHPKCRRIPPQGWMPKRILDVGSLPEPVLRLCLRTEQLHSIKYATLSHCWGRLDIKRLQKSSLTSMMEAICMEDLPKTFQEAINFARNLGIRYLWIDSLCILQDSPEDWAEESANMEKIYQFAECNIAAAAAKDGNDGCFFDRDPRLVQVCRLRLKTSAYNSETDVFDLIPQGLWSGRPRSSPLSKRAWVLQEQVIAPRIIHCDKTQLLWECQHIGLCEMYPKDIPHDAIFDAYAFNFKWETVEITSKNSLIPLKGDDTVGEYCSYACRSWDRLMYDYASRLLTNEQDKLIAISGIARVFEPQIQDATDPFGYLAGLWGHFLPVQLLWQTFEPPVASRYPARPECYRAPSWSWASIDGITGPFLYSLPANQEFMVQITEAETKAIGRDKMGQISSGIIRLTGSLKAFQLTDEEVRGSYILQDDDIAAFLWPDIPHLLQAGRHFLCLPIVELVNTGLHRMRIDPSKAIFGLMIEKTNTNGQYTRIGTFRTTESGRSLFRTKTYKDARMAQAKSAFDAKKSGHFSRETASISITEIVPQFDVAGREGWVESVITIV